MRIDRTAFGEITIDGNWNSKTPSMAAKTYQTVTWRLRASGEVFSILKTVKIKN
jgi:hypothetical protein